MNRTQGFQGLSRGSWPEPARGASIVLNVTNDYGSPVEIYAIGSGTYYRMGTVFPGLKGHFVLRQSMMSAGPVEFVAQIDRNPVVRSGRLVLTAGDIVDFEIANNQLNSSAVVRP